MIGDALSPQVSPHFIVKIEEHLSIHQPEAHQHRLRMGNGDVNVARAPGTATTARSGDAQTPAHVLLPQVELLSETYLEIRDRKDRALITVIELLSPTNKKPGPDRDQYLTKRANVLRSAAHLRGDRPPARLAADAERKRARRRTTASW